MQHLSALTVTVKLVVNCAPCFVRVSSVWFIIYAICLSFCSVPLLSTFLKYNLRWDETEKKIIFSSEKLKPYIIYQYKTSVHYQRIFCQ